MSSNHALNKKIDDFSKKLNRSHFVSGIYKRFAPLNLPLPIGFFQTISQPSLVAQMTKELKPAKNSRVLEIGTGSGYQTALLAEFSYEVYTVERIEKLSNKAQKRLEKLGYNNIHFKIGNGSKGWQKYAPYDRIMVTASAAQLPNELLTQLKAGGKMIIPVGRGIFQKLLLIEKDKKDNIAKKTLALVKFVRLHE